MNTLDVCCLCLEECNEKTNCCKNTIHSNCMHDIFISNAEYINKRLLINCPYCRSNIITGDHTIVQLYLTKQSNNTENNNENNDVSNTRSTINDLSIFICIGLFGTCIIIMTVISFLRSNSN